MVLHSRRVRLLFITFVWLCFVARGLFYCSFLPVWEGYDEWAHFAVIERMVTGQKLLVNRREPVGLDVQQSMALAPEPWNAGQSFTNEDDYWRLPVAERTERMRKLADIPIGWAREQDPAARLFMRRSNHLFIIGSRLFFTGWPQIGHCSSACFYSATSAYLSVLSQFRSSI